jgi:hypothetical protein
MNVIDSTIFITIMHNASAYQLSSKYSTLCLAILLTELSVLQKHQPHPFWKCNVMITSMTRNHKRWIGPFRNNYCKVIGTFCVEKLIFISNTYCVKSTLTGTMEHFYNVKHLLCVLCIMSMKWTHIGIILLHFLQSVIPKWWMNKLVRWDRH